MACGRPVIAFGGGGALDTVAPGSSGELFGEQNVESLLAVLKKFDPSAYGVETCRAQAEKFSRANFRHKLVKYIEQVMAVSSY